MRTYKIFGIKCYKLSEIRNELKDRFELFEKFITGQACIMKKGKTYIYVHDFEDWKSQHEY